MVLYASAVTLVSLDWVLTHAAISLAGSRIWPSASKSLSASTVMAMLSMFSSRLVAVKTNFSSTASPLLKPASWPAKSNKLVLTKGYSLGSSVRVANAAATSLAVTLVLASTVKPATVTD